MSCLHPEWRDFQATAYYRGYTATVVLPRDHDLLMENDISRYVRRVRAIVYEVWLTEGYGLPEEEAYQTANRAFKTGKLPKIDVAINSMKMSTWSTPT